MDDEKRKSFVAYTEWMEHIEALDCNTQLRLLKAVFSYACDSSLPKGFSAEELVIFNFMKSSIDRDSIKWENTREKRREAGKASAIKRKTKADQNKINDSLLKDSEVLKSATEEMNITQEEAVAWLKTFMNQIKSRNIEHKSLNDAKAHFLDWLKIKLKNKKDETSDVARRIEICNHTSREEHF
jgi:hypothetical protein